MPTEVSKEEADALGVPWRIESEAATGIPVSEEEANRLGIPLTEPGVTVEATVSTEAVSPMTDELRPAPTFGQRVGRAIDAFKQTIQPDDFIDAFDPFKFPKAIMAAREQLDPGGLDFAAPITGPMSDFQKMQVADSPNIIEREGLVPALVGKLSRIEPIAKKVEELKAQPEPDDSFWTAAGKATQNVALDMAGAMASPLGVALGASGSGFMPLKTMARFERRFGPNAMTTMAMKAPKATAAAMTPLVIESIQTAARNVAEDESQQKQIEGVLTSVLGVGGTLAALRTPKTGTATPSKPPASTAIAKEAVEGAAALEKELGIEAPLSAAEATGSKGMATREAFAKRIGSGDGTTPLPYQAKQLLVADKVKQIVSEQAEQAGSKAEVGAQVAREITAGEEALRGEVGKAAGKAVQEIAAGAEEQIGAIGAKAEQTDVGATAQDSMNFSYVYDKARGRSMYQTSDKLIKQAGGTAEFVDPVNVPQLATQILSEAPKRETPVPTGVLGPNGQPIMTVKREVIPQFLPAYQKIKELATWKAPQTAEEMQRAISLIGESIGRLESGAADTFGGGFQLGDLKRLYGALSQDFDQSIAKLSPAARDAYQKARTFHKENIDRFEQNPVIAKIMNPASQGGVANLGEVAGMFARGKGKLQDLEAIKQFLPAPMYGDFKAGIINSLRSNNSIPTAAGYVEDLSGFAKDFRNLAPEFQRELMGSPEKAKALQATLEKFAVGKKAVDVLGDRDVATPGVLERLVDDIKAGKAVEGNRAFMEAIAKEDKRVKAYFNSVTKDIRSGSLGKTKPIDPAEFIDGWLLKTDNVDEVRTGLQQLSPETRGRVQKLLSQKLFELAIDQENSTVKQLLAGQGEVSGQKLIDLFVSDPKRAQIVQAVIPEQNKELLTNFIKYQRGIENARKLGGNSGMLASQAVIGGGMNATLFGTLVGVGKSFVKSKIFRLVSEAFFSDFGRNIMTRVADGNWVPQAVAAWSLSKMGVNKMPTLPREALGVMNAEFGAAKVQEYLNKKAEIDEILNNATPEEVDAAMMLIPEVAYPLEVEPQPDEPVVAPEPAPAPEVAVEVVEAPVAAPEPVPAPQPPKRNVIAPKGTRVRQNGRIYVYDGKEWKPE